MKKIFLKSAFVLLALAGHMVVADESDYASSVQVTQLLKTTVTTIGQPIKYPKTDSAEVTALRVVLPPGKETGWHKHPVPSYGYILSGTLTLEMEGGKTFEFKAGQALIEVLNVLHNGKNLGKEPVELVVFYMGEKGKPNTVKASPADVVPGSSR